MSEKLEKATLGGGCFWCLDAAYRLINGIKKVTSGYSGGLLNNPTYEQVASGDSGHAEVVQIEFDPKAISYKDILDVFWAIHDPTTLNHQGADIGSQYRSVIFYHDSAQKAVAAETKEEVAKLWKDPVVTEILPLDKFWPAEDYHQNFYQTNPSQMYCQAVINPKITKLQKKFQNLIKK